MVIKRGLGKGLSALISDEDNNFPEKPVLENREPVGAKTTGEAKPGEIFVPLEKLKPNPNQPRKDFNEEELAELAMRAIDGE